jgi:transposase InsO family protein
LTERHVDPSVSAEVVSVVERLHVRAGYAIKSALAVLGLPRSTYFSWSRMRGKSVRPAGKIPKSHVITPDERRAVLAFARAHPRNGYKRLSYMMNDAGVAAVRPSTVLNILHEEQLIGPWATPSTTAHKIGFDQPTRPHEQWHTDIAYLNILGTQYFFISVLDGFSRAIIHHDVRIRMETTDVEIVLQRALETIPHDIPRPRLISDNGSQYISAQFKNFLRETGCAHSKARVRHPQSNGKIERFHKSIKTECIRATALGHYEEACRVIADYVQYYNNIRLHSAIHYLTPNDLLKGHDHIAHKLAQRKNAYQNADENRRTYWKNKLVA